MRLKLVDVGLTSSNMALVEFSDGRVAQFTAKDLISLARFLETPEPMPLESAIESVGIALCEPKLPIHLTQCIRSNAKSTDSEISLASADTVQAISVADDAVHAVNARPGQDG